MENSQIYYLSEMNLSNLVYYLHAISFLLCLSTIKGSPKPDEKSLCMLASLIPFVGLIFGVASFWEILTRTINSKGKCFLGHDLKEVFSSERNKWKNGNMPMRLSIGGYEDYECQKCSHKERTRWSAF